MAEYTKDIYGVQQQIADEKAKSERDFLADSYNLASVQGGMMLANARDIGMRQGNVYANIGRMLTGEEEPVDPRMARMQKLQSIMEQIPEPDTYDEYIKLANLMNQAGLYGDAQEAMKMAKEQFGIDGKVEDMNFRELGIILEYVEYLEEMYREAGKL